MQQATQMPGQCFGMGRNTAPVSARYSNDLKLGTKIAQGLPGIVCGKINDRDFDLCGEILSKEAVIKPVKLPLASHEIIASWRRFGRAAEIAAEDWNARDEFLQ